MKKLSWEEYVAIAEKINSEGYVYVECLPHKEWKRRGYPIDEESISIIDHIAKAKKKFSKLND